MKTQQGQQRDVGPPEQGSWEVSGAADTAADKGGLSDSEGDRAAGMRSRREQDERKWTARRHATRKLKVAPSALAAR